ncbi:MAG: class I SAM-dependent methyltransferase, partial [Chloroflexota bacterium]
QGPGSPESTRRAWTLCDGLPDTPDILDVGCGSGMQTMTLAELTDGQFVAVDYHQVMLDEFKDKLMDSPLASRIRLQQADMKNLPFDEASFDLIWSEGAIYIMGMEAGLSAWRKLLKPNGLIAFSEVVWIQNNRPDAIREFWELEYPSIATVDENLEQIDAVGYDVLGHFTLPDSDWWTHFYMHLNNKLPALEEKYADHEVAQGLLEGTHHEIAMRRDYGTWYSYEFFVCRSR